MAAANTRERDAVRRIIGDKLTEADLDANKARTWPNCCGACRRTGLCPTPQACQLSAEPEPTRPPPPRGGDMLRVIAFLLCAWAAVAATLLVLGVRP